MLTLVSDFLGDAASSEADHRIANHLSLIASLLRMQKKALKEARSFSRQDAEWLLDDCGRRIETVARVHRLLAGRGDEHAQIDVREYLGDLARGIVEGIATSSECALDFSCDDDVAVVAEHVAPLGLLVGELVTNAVKYSHPAGVRGKIAVHCSRGADGAIIVSVSDDGVGLPEDFDPQVSGNIGFRMMRSLVQRLQGELDFDSSGLGLGVTLKIPAPRAPHTLVVVDQARRQ
jgi:two-component sensor histidine kinase